MPPRPASSGERPVTRDPAARALLQRRRLLVAALAAARLADAPGAGPVPADCRRWLDRWAGVGLVAAGMARQGFDLELTRFGDEGWRATFSPAGRAHSVVSGTGWQATPWRAVQHAAWEALQHA
jgi:hypothetical protein